MDPKDDAKTQAPDAHNAADGKKRRRRRRRKNKTQNDGNEAQNANVTQDKVKSKKPKKKKKRSRPRSRRFDRYYGAFHCKICGRTWESAHVYTYGGTFNVVGKQRCKSCIDDDAWFNPYNLALIQCRECRQRPCICLCEDCGKLKHRPPPTQDPNQATGTDTSQPPKEYCHCRKKKRDMRCRNDPKKRHLSELCELCQKGFPCVLANNGSDHDSDDAGNGDEP